MKPKLFSYLAVSSVPLKITAEKKGIAVSIQLEEDRRLELDEYLDRATYEVLKQLPQ